MRHVVMSDLVEGRSYDVCIAGVLLPCVYLGYDSGSNRYKFCDEMNCLFYFFPSFVRNHIYQMNRDNNP